ncbi:MAG: hypothetical protein U9N57_01270 [Pseudomonadota bacterium]|nr:hypothetical protein [Pseudomonadota bacterium]
MKRNEEQVKPSALWDEQIGLDDFPGYRPPTTEYYALAKDYDDLIHLLDEDWYDHYVYCFELTEQQEQAAKEKAWNNKVKLTKMQREDYSYNTLGELLDRVNEKGARNVVYVIKLEFDLKTDLSEDEIKNGIELWNQRTIFVIPKNGQDDEFIMVKTTA